MKNLNLLILEDHADYGRRLADYIGSRTDSPFLVRLFLQHPCPESDLLEANAVLISSGLWPEYRDRLSDLPSLVLTDEALPPDGTDAAIYKYQSASRIFEALQRCCLAHGGSTVPAENFLARSFRISAIYTPGCSRKSSDLLLSRLHREAADRSVLYINMEQVPSRVPAGSESGEGLSTLIYYLKQYHENVGSRLSLMVRREDFDYLLPADYFGEILEMDPTDWKELAGALHRETGYEQVYLDFGASLPVSGALPFCDEILVLHQGTPWEEEMISRFLSLLVHAAGEEVRDKVHIQTP